MNSPESEASLFKPKNQKIRNSAIIKPKIYKLRKELIYTSVPKLLACKEENQMLKLKSS
jgi:hypothetical protein